MEVADLIGKPYRLGGRGPDDYDCAGLAIALQSRQGRAVAIPDSPQEKEDRVAAMLRILRSGWLEIPAPQVGCLVFLRQAHVGTMIDRIRFVHCTSADGSVFVERLDDPEWRRSVGGFYLPR